MYCTAIVYVALFFIGMYLYINGMVEDLKKTMRQSGRSKDDMWSTYLEEIHLHNDIIELSLFIGTIYPHTKFRFLWKHSDIIPKIWRFIRMIP